MLFLNFQLRLVGTALCIAVMLGKLLHLHDRSCNFIFKLRCVTVLHEGMKTESCLMITAGEHLAVCPESQRTGAAGTCNAGNEWACIQ